MIKALSVATVLMAFSCPLAAAADGCGPGCHATIEGACVVDGWGRPGIRNECPAGAQPRPPCPSGYAWHSRKRACFAS